MRVDALMPDRLRQYGPTMLLLLACVWLAASAADLFWLLSGKSRPALPPAPRVVMVEARPDTSRPLAADLFGRTPVASLAVSGDGPDTSLPLVLRGVFLAADPALSSALINENAQPQARMFHVDEPLPGGATLLAVRTDRILLRRGDGRQEVLRFSKTPRLLGDPAKEENKAQDSAGKADR